MSDDIIAHKLCRMYICCIHEPFGKSGSKFGSVFFFPKKSQYVMHIMNNTIVNRFGYSKALSFTAAEAAIVVVIIRFVHSNSVNKMREKKNKVETFDSTQNATEKPATTRTTGQRMTKKSERGTSNSNFIRFKLETQQTYKIYARDFGLSSFVFGFRLHFRFWHFSWKKRAL